MTTKLCVWGNSLGVRLPKHVAEVSGVQAGDYLFITVNEAREIVIRPVKPRDVHPPFARNGAKVKVKGAVPAEAVVQEKW